MYFTNRNSAGKFRALIILSYFKIQYRHNMVCKIMKLLQDIGTRQIEREQIRVVTRNNKTIV